MTKSSGLISSLRDPTALNARMAWTPICFRAAMLAWLGTSEGEYVWPVPCLARKATGKPEEE